MGIRHFLSSVTGAIKFTYGTRPSMYRISWMFLESTVSHVPIYEDSIDADSIFE